jgi:hypothetical protein
MIWKLLTRRYEEREEEQWGRCGYLPAWRVIRALSIALWNSFANFAASRENCSFKVDMAAPDPKPCLGQELVNPPEIRP